MNIKPLGRALTWLRHTGNYMAAFEKPLFTRILSGYTYLLLGLFGSAPMLALTYLEINRQPGLLYEHHGFHIIAISIAIAIGAFITFVTWRCYADSGEPFLRWLTLGFLGFTLIYAPHGLFTPLAHQNPWLFLLYGPASRVVMAACFLTAMFHYAAADAPSKRWRPRTWLIAIAIFIGIDLVIGLLAISPLRAAAWLRLSMEYTAIGLFVIVIAWLITQRIRNPLMVMYAVSMAWFAQSSLAFSLDTAWSHQWWLAHVIFAGGFFLLSYGVIQAYLSTRSFARVYSQAELLEEVLAQKQRAEETMVELQRANAKLERLAATDPLTGAANRRELMQRAEQEAARAVRNHAPPVPDSH
ncbi:hypothetical protein Tel_15510 [Candidatus Tenderia electrophaga]|uniref:7TM-DISM receptor extracellular domain-containing protein n=1 Tax=Candidatus Tenderia electrophaga TaxID=1748243 RepID=A0A0S2TH33_9GAMM|nr:hypothetical protein Tel_15510 [Candidatus Tenderia electrophaga]